MLLLITAFLGAILSGVGVSVSQTLAGTCKADPAPQIAALPPGGTFIGSGCYDTAGIVVTQNDVTLNFNGGWLLDSADRPVIDVKNATGDTVENVHVDGTNPSGSFVPANVYQAGVELQSTVKTTLTNVTTWATGGDGLELWTDEPVTGRNVGQLTVDNYKVSDAGRMCVTLGFVYNASLTGVDCASQADDAFDFESDDPGIGNGYVSISNSSGRYVNDNAASLGPITFTDCNLSEIVWDDSAANGYPFTINGGTLDLVRTPHGTPPGAVTASGRGDLVLNNVGVTRNWLGSTLPLSGYSYVVTGVSSLTLEQSPIPGPPGYVDHSSTLTSS